MSSPHDLEHRRLKAAVADLYARIGEAIPNAPTPTPAPAPAPAGDTLTFSAGTLPAACSITRATTAYGRNGATVASVAINTARFETTVQGNVGIVLEQAYTNLFANGQQPGVVANGWSALGTAPTVTAGQTDPAGGTTAVRIQMAGGTNGVRKAVSMSIARYLMTIWLKSNTGVQQEIYLRDPNTNAYASVSVPATGWTKFAMHGIVGTGFNFDIANAMVGAADVIAWSAGFGVAVGLTNAVSDYPSNSGSTVTRNADVMTVTGLTNGSRDIQVDYVDEPIGNGSIVTQNVLEAITVSGGTYAFDPSAITAQAYRVIKQMRFITAGSSSPTPAPTPSPPPPSGGTAPTTVFATDMTDMNAVLPLVTTTFWPGFKRCGGYVNDQYPGGGTALYPWLEIAAIDPGTGSSSSYFNAPNSQLRIGYFRVYRDRRDGNGWQLAFVCDKLSDFYHWNWYDKRGYDMNGYAVQDAYLAVARPGGYAVPLSKFRDAYYNVMHHYPSTGNLSYNGTDRISVQLQVKIELIDVAGTDDRANIPICGHVATDWNNAKGEHMHASFKQIPTNGSPILLTCTNIDVYKSCGSCALDGGGCSNYLDGVFTAAELNSEPPPIPTFF